MKNKFLKGFVASFALAVSGLANAGLIIDFTDIGSDTLVTFSGTFDYTGLSVSNSEIAYWQTESTGSGSGYDIIRVGSGNVTWGANGGSTHFELFTGTFNQVLSDLTGGGFGFWNFIGGGHGNYYLPTDYVSGDALLSSGKLIGLNISDLGINNTGVWKTLSNQETVSITLNRATEVPEPSTLAVLTLGLMGLASRKFKKQI